MQVGTQLCFSSKPSQQGKKGMLVERLGEKFFSSSEKFQEVAFYDVVLKSLLLIFNRFNEESVFLSRL